MIALLGLSLRAMPDFRRPAVMLLVLTFLAMAKFYAHELVLGQVNLLFGVIVVARARLAARRTRRRGGPAVGAGRRRQAVRGDLPAVARDARRNRGAFVDDGRRRWSLLLVLPAVRYGWNGNLRCLRDWWQTVTDDDGAQPDQPGQRVAERDVHEVAGPRVAGRRLAAVGGADAPGRRGGRRSPHAAR